METDESIKFTFPNKLEYSYLVQQFVREIAKKIGFSGETLDQIDIAIEESVSNVMVHASDEENPTFDIICEKIHDGMKITIKETGIPFDPEQIKKYKATRNLDDLSTAGLGIYLIQKVMDDLSFRNLGRKGKETVMIKYLPATAVGRDLVSRSEEKPRPGIIEGKIEYVVRDLKEHEAIEVSRCAYKTHGYTFFDDHIYYPERLVEMNRNCEMISAVAVTKDNVFMGHGALLYQYPEDTIAELTFFFVNVEYRGQGALNRMVEYLFQVPKKRELRGIYGYAVTNHIFSQKSTNKFRLVDCGILLATSPSSWKFKGITDDLSQRISVVLNFKYMEPPRTYDLYAPEHHKEMIKKLYLNLGASHNCVVPATSTVQFERLKAVFKTGVNELEGCAEIFIDEYGADAIMQLRKILRDFCIRQIPAINLFLNLKDPKTYWITKEIEQYGFFFAGILPESRIGEALVLQYLNNVSIDYNKIMLVSDIAKELLTYIRDHDPNIIT
jgi:serine/threonine-protein kinase RsbW